MIGRVVVASEEFVEEHLEHVLWEAEGISKVTVLWDVIGEL